MDVLTAPGAAAPIQLPAAPPPASLKQDGVDALFEDACTGLCWRNGVAGMDEMCNVGRACK